jgi:sulfoxide reductase heme-binding subunit YedZ
VSGASSTFFWITSRAAGTTAMILASAAVGVGLTMGGRLIKRGAPDRRSIHEVLSLATIVAIAVHGLALLGDTYFPFTLTNIALPFLSPYRSLATALGIIAGWGMAVLGLSFYARRRIGQRRWKTIHRFTAVAWLLGLIHTFAVGSDAAKPWFIALIGVTAAPALILLIVRHLRPGMPARPAVAGTR